MLILSFVALYAHDILFSHLFVTAIKNMEQEGKVGGKQTRVKPQF